jgi:hypothetical protein
VSTIQVGSVQCERAWEVHSAADTAVHKKGLYHGRVEVEKGHETSLQRAKKKSSRSFVGRSTICSGCVSDQKGTVMKLYAVYIMHADGFWHLSSFRLGKNRRRVIRQFPQYNNKHTLVCLGPKSDLGTGTQKSAPVFSDEQPPSDPSPTPSAFALDLFGFGVYTFPPGAAGAMSFHDPLEGTETSVSEDKQEVIMLPSAKLELIVKLADFLCDGYLDKDPDEGTRAFQTAVGFTVPQDVKDEAYGIYYSYAASEWAQQKNF